MAMNREPSADAYNDACVDWEQGDLEKAFIAFSEQAFAGNADAMSNLGVFYELGLFTTVDQCKAIYWYKAAWRQGRSQTACANLADLYWKSRQQSRAFHWIGKCIKAGSGNALLEKAKWLLKRSRNKKIQRRAIGLLRRACDSQYISQDGVEEAETLLDDCMRKFLPTS
jgi:TPR repeat protein